jgi:hypothetical protein
MNDETTRALAYVAMALKELVRLKDIKEKLESDTVGPRDAWKSDYDNNKEKAWAAARIALAVMDASITSTIGETDAALRIGLPIPEAKSLGGRGDLPMPTVAELKAILDV